MTVQNEIGPGGAPTPFAPGLTDWKESAVSDAICSIEGCGNPKDARGWCKSHWNRWRRHGDPTGGTYIRVNCTIDGCHNPHLARGYCRLHYKRWESHGDPNATVALMASSPEESFQARTERRGECLIWTGAADALGYGTLWVNGTAERVHRYAWERTNGPIPDGMFIDHKCWTPSCVEVKHLRMATPAENARYLRGARVTNRSTGVRNVVRTRSGNFQVYMNKDNARHYFGTYSTIEEAAAVAREARTELFGAFAGQG